MLIYVNQLHFSGERALEEATNSICGWLKQITGRYFTADELLGSQEFTCGLFKVRAFAAKEEEPELHAVLLTHPDRDVAGRQWVTEIGIKVSDREVMVSVLVETIEKSTLVKQYPISTRPKLIDYLSKNSLLENSTIGNRMKVVRPGQSHLDGLKYLIFDEGRDYPLVIVSASPETGKPLIDPDSLQKYLIGLAQVVLIAQDVDDSSQEQTLSRKYAAWNGAINIIYPYYNSDSIGRRLLLDSAIKEASKSGLNLNHFILSFVTHITNITKKKIHFSPADVRAKRQRDTRIRLQAALAEKGGNEDDYYSLAEEAFKEIDELEARMEEVKSALERELDIATSQLVETQDERDESKRAYESLRSSYEALSSSNANKQGKPLLYYGCEGDLYEGEIKGLLVQVLEQVQRQNDKHRRKSHILEDVVKANRDQGDRNRLIRELKSIFSSYDGVTPKIRASINELGMEIVEDGNHNHLKFIGDKRYQVSFAKTPSDKRVGDNIIRDIKSEML